jgi:hypothetical protein
LSDIVKAGQAAQDAIDKLIQQGDLKGLTPAQRSAYYRAFCASHGLDPATQPFQFLTLNGKLVLYATRVAAEQLRLNHGISLRITKREAITRKQLIDPDEPEKGERDVPDSYRVTVKAKNRVGRVDEEDGAVDITGLRGEALCNAMMRAITKAKRRVTFSMCGIGLPDETEVETIRGAVPVPMQQALPEGQ